MSFLKFLVLFYNEIKLICQQVFLLDYLFIYLSIFIYISIYSNNQYLEMFGNNISLRCISFLLSFHFSIILSSPLSTYYYKHICLSFQLSRNPFIFLSINLTIYLSLYLFIFLSIYLLIYYLSSPPPSNIYFSVCQLTCLKKMYN